MKPINNHLRRLSTMSSSDLRFTLNFALVNGGLGLLSGSLEYALLRATTGAIAGFAMDAIKVLHGRSSRLNGSESGTIPLVNIPVLPLRRVPVATAIMVAAGSLLYGTVAPLLPTLGDMTANAVVDAVASGVTYGVGGILGSEYLYWSKYKRWANQFGSIW